MGPLDLITAPVLGPIQLIYWLGQKLAEAAWAEMYDEGHLLGEIAELQARLDLGEVTAEEYEHQETTLLERINAVRQAKE